MATLDQSIADLTAAAEALTGTVSTKIADIDAQVTAKKAEVDGFIAGARSEMPFVNIFPVDSFKLVAAGVPGWPGFTANANGDWQFTDEFIELSSVVDLAAVDLVNTMKLNRFDRAGWFLRKITITGIGTPTATGESGFHTGLRFSSAGPGKISAGYMRRINGEPWTLFVRQQAVGNNEADWGANSLLSEYPLGTEIYLAMPFVCAGIPATVPFPAKLLSAQAA